MLHQQPPNVSSLRPELSEQHDEVCRRLLAKHPEARERVEKEADSLGDALGAMAPSHESLSRLEFTRRVVLETLRLYPPFALGGRRCIGEEFALTEATIVLAAFAQRLEFRLAPGFEIVAGLMGFGPIRAKSGIAMSIHRRTTPC